ncbi:unnamed protein product [Prorocentrum cordatum]|uniref:Uncharacterized protein n=1 Tax=Prorocentrum cordatum TaxID=2364126 RepID=A0ABN9T7A8_9DINO|nr:unnamed protein product [Polarella glacialis]
MHRARTCSDAPPPAAQPVRAFLRRCAGESASAREDEGRACDCFPPRSNRKLRASKPCDRAKRSPLALPAGAAFPHDGLVRQHLALGERRLHQHPGAAHDTLLLVRLAALLLQLKGDRALVLLHLEQLTVRVREPLLAAEVGAAGLGDRSVELRRARTLHLPPAGALGAILLRVQGADLHESECHQHHRQHARHRSAECTAKGVVNVAAEWNGWQAP